MVKVAFLPLMSIVLLLLVISERPAGAYIVPEPPAMFSR